MSFPRLSGKEVVILQLLQSGGEMYGLEMVRASDRLKRGTIYVMLQRMEEKGYVTSRKEHAGSQGRSPRRIYRMTGAGARALRAHHAGSAAEQAAWCEAW